MLKSNFIFLIGNKDIMQSTPSLTTQAAIM